MQRDEKTDQDVVRWIARKTSSRTLMQRDEKTDEDVVRRSRCALQLLKVLRDELANRSRLAPHWSDYGPLLLLLADIELERSAAPVEVSEVRAPRLWEGETTTTAMYRGQRENAVAFGLWIELKGPIPTKVRYRVEEVLP